MGGNLIIVAGGALFDAKKVLSNIVAYDDVIAVDSGFDNCIKLGLKPSVLIGDCDSVKADICNIDVIKFNPIKDETDLKIAVDFAHKNGAENLTFLCCTGGRLDHLLNNFSILNYAFSLGMQCEMIDEFNVVTVVNSYKKFKNISKYVSVIPVDDKVCCTVTNMKYPMENMIIWRENIVSISNECVSDEFEITVKSGRAFVILAD